MCEDMELCILYINIYMGPLISKYVIVSVDVCVYRYIMKGIPQVEDQMRPALPVSFIVCNMPHAATGGSALAAPPDR